jgi:hypothetical protein
VLVQVYRKTEGGIVLVTKGGRGRGCCGLCYSGAPQAFLKVLLLQRPIFDKRPTSSLGQGLDEAKRRQRAIKKNTQIQQNIYKFYKL